VRHGMKVQLVTPYRVSHLQRYGVTVRGNITSVYSPLCSWIATDFTECLKLCVNTVPCFCCCAGEYAAGVKHNDMFHMQLNYLMAWVI
jgi:hypothetical protein